MGGGKGGGGSANIPNPPKIDQSYAKGVDVYLKYLPQLLGSEQAARNTYDPQRIQEQQALQQQYGPTQYNQQLSAFRQLAPGYINANNVMGNAAVSGVEAGTQLLPGEATQLQQEVRGAQAARGNIYGDAPAISEAYTLGDRGQQLYQQRLGNLAGYLQLPTVATQVGQVNPIGIDRTSAYTDPNAGFQGLNAANARYQAQASIAAAQGGGNAGAAGQGWGSTIGGIAGGILGTVAFPGVGTLGGYQIGSGIGGGLGGAIGSTFGG